MASLTARRMADFGRGHRPAACERLSSEQTPKVALQDITLRYKTNGSALLALDRINLQVKAGEFLCIVGPSGCGKSTLLHLIAGLQRPTSGTVLIDGKPVHGPGTDRILIFQELGLFPWLTVADNVEFGMKMKGIPKARAQAESRVLPAAGTTFAVRGQLYPPAFRRNAAAGGVGPRAGDRAGCPADG